MTSFWVISLLICGLEAFETYCDSTSNMSSSRLSEVWAPHIQSVRVERRSQQQARPPWITYEGTFRGVWMDWMHGNLIRTSSPPARSFDFIFLIFPALFMSANWSPTQPRPSGPRKNPPNSGGCTNLLGIFFWCVHVKPFGNGFFGIWGCVLLWEIR